MFYIPILNIRAVWVVRRMKNVKNCIKFETNLFTNNGNRI